MKGLICAGGTATRLEELTRVTNKHLLPVGRWPMVYYPLQLLQRVGVSIWITKCNTQASHSIINGMSSVAMKLRLQPRKRRFKNFLRAKEHPKSTHSSD